MREDEFRAWSDDACAWYAGDLVENGGMRPEPAQRKAEADLAGAFTQGEVHARGFDRIMLNVFGGNERARALYRNLGYDEAAVHMLKELG